MPVLNEVLNRMPSLDEASMSTSLDSVIASSSNTSHDTQGVQSQSRDPRKAHRRSIEKIPNTTPAVRSVSSSSGTNFRILSLLSKLWEGR